MPSQAMHSVKSKGIKGKGSKNLLRAKVKVLGRNKSSGSQDAFKIAKQAW
jgi:hypothetical protein